MTIQDILFWILFALSIGAVIWYILGDSPTLEQLLLFFVLTMAVKTSTLLVKTSGRVANIGSEVKAIRSDLEVLQGKSKSIEDNLVALTENFQQHVRRKQK